MQSNFVDGDGFQIVSSKKSIKKGKLFKTTRNNISSEPPTINELNTLKQIKEAKADLTASEFWKTTLDLLVSSTKGEIHEILCYGIGHIAECKIARYQLAFLLTIHEKYQKPVKIHDPILYEAECRILNSLNLVVIEENKEAVYEISDKGNTLVYMPHCPKQLTNNLLWSNFNINLKHLILISNSLENIIGSNLKKHLEQSISYIYKIQPHTKEIKLDNNFKYTDVFNDTSIHLFPEENLIKFKENYWLKGNKPLYKDETEFITSLIIEKLKFTE